MLLVYNYVLLKMSTWYSKHVEESNNIWRINNIHCITLVLLYGGMCFFETSGTNCPVYTITFLYLFLPWLAPCGRWNFLRGMGVVHWIIYISIICLFTYLYLRCKIYSYPVKQTKIILKQLKNTTVISLQN